MTDKKMHSVKYNFIMNSILKMSSFVFPMITFPYITRVLGADAIGKVNFANALTGYFSMAAMLGIPTYGIRICAQCRDDRNKLAQIVQELLIINIVMTVIVYIILFVLVLKIPLLYENRNLIFVLSFTISLTTIGMEWLLQAIEEYRFITYRNLVFKCFSVALIFLLVHHKEDYILYAGISMFGTVGSNILNFIRIRRYISFKPRSSYNFRRHIRPVLLFFLFSVATTVYTNLDIVMLGFMSNDRQTGYYSVAVKMKNLFVSLVTALGTVLLPRACYYVENEMDREFAESLKKAFQFVMLSSIPLVVFFMIEARDTIVFLAGEKFIDAVQSMRIILPTVFLIGCSNLIGMQILIPMGLEVCTIFSVITGAVIDLLLNMILIPQTGAVGAATGTLAAEAGVLLIQVIQIRKKGKVSYIKTDLKDILKILAAVAGASVAIVAAQMKIFTDIHGYLIRFLILWSIFCGTYGILLLAVKEKMVMQIWKKIKD